MNWAAINGLFEFTDSSLVFRGEPTKYGEQLGMSVGLAIAAERFVGGSLEATVIFEKIGDRNTCELVFYFDPARTWFVSAGIGGPIQMYVIRHWDGKWTTHAATGNRANLIAHRPYRLSVDVRGSRVALSVDEVEVAAAVLPFALPASQVGVSCIDDAPIRVEDFRVQSRRGRVFVVMEFASPYNEIHQDVIKKVCEEFGLDARRADETYGPGLILADVTREITESEFVIAEITPANPNVYYELGFAHATNKPTILLADRQAIKQLPFDVSPFRVLFYENSIAGKARFEEGLRKHIAAILAQGTIR